MGRNRAIKKKVKKASLEAKVFGEVANEEKKPRFTVEQLLQKAEENIDEFNYEVAQKFCQRALAIEPDNLRCLETSGTLCLELGDIDTAKQYFGRAVELQPEEGHSKYMYLGQLHTGLEAVQYFQKGIQLMVKEVEKQQTKEVASACGSNNDSTLTVADISAAYCSIAELYMTDCCDEEDAESRCKENIEAAMQVDAENAEAVQLMASFYLLKQDKPGAKDLIEKSLSLWLPQYKEAAEKSEAATALDPIQLTTVPYQSRLGAAKILIEVEQFETASEVLELLLDEDDQIIQCWYLLGWLNYLQGEDYMGNARFYLMKAAELAKKIGCEEEDMLKHIEELRTEIGEEEEDDEMEEKEDFEIGSDSDEEMEQ